MSQGQQMQRKSRQTSLAGHGKHKSRTTGKEKASFVLVRCVELLPTCICAYAILGLPVFSNLTHSNALHISNEQYIP